MRALSTLLLAGAVGLGGLLAVPGTAAADGGWRGRNHYRGFGAPGPGYYYGGRGYYGPRVHYGGYYGRRATTVVRGATMARGAITAAITRPRPSSTGRRRRPSSRLRRCSTVRRSSRRPRPSMGGSTGRRAPTASRPDPAWACSSAEAGAQRSRLSHHRRHAL